MKKKQLKYLLSIVISVIILVVIYRKINFKELIPLMGDIKVLPFSIFIILILLQLVIASQRWRVILAAYGDKKMSLFQSSKYVVGSYSANLIIPAKMGEVVRVAWEKDKEKRTETFKLVLFEKLLDISAVFLIFVLSLVFVLTTKERLGLFLVAGAAPIVLGTLAVFSISRFGLLNKLPKKIKGFLDFYADNVKLNPKFYGIVLISVVLWIIQITQFYFMFLSFDIQLPLLESYAGNALAVLAGAFVPSIGGIGPRDATIIWFFKSAAESLPLIAIGAVSALRIIVPALIGLPFFFQLTRKV